MKETCSCQDNQETSAEIRFYCNKCKEEKKKITIKKPLKAGVISIFLTYSGVQVFDYAIENNRYPLEVESEIINACTNYYRESVTPRLYEMRRSVCLCALRDTMNEISYIRYKIDEKAFLKAFKAKAPLIFSIYSCYLELA